ncbi:hypothetical protein TNCV_1518781 [Trichonephila clavipes]|nr:hypothetical protein TNCV_1518781 [Trichonephila clavipes]
MAAGPEVDAKLWDVYESSKEKDFGNCPLEIGNGIEEVVDLAKKINLGVDSDNIQKQMDCHKKEFTIDELIEMHELRMHEHRILESLSSTRKTNYDWEFDRRPV